MSKDSKLATQAAGPAVITPARAEKFLARVPQDKVFWSNDGRVLRDMKDLVDALANISDQTFAYHANAIKNDFSNWVRSILEDDKLVSDLEQASNREQAAGIVEERVVGQFEI